MMTLTYNQNMSVIQRLIVQLWLFNDDHNFELYRECNVTVQLCCK
jgi:hypothetical protein